MILRSTWIAIGVILVLVWPSSTSDTKEDPYEILGVSRSSSPEQIKKAYKKLARNWHPDRNQDPQAQDKFIKINSAYEILSDSEKRRDYDHYGHDGLNRQHQSRREPFFDSQSGFSFFFNDGPSQSHTRRDFISNQFYDSHIIPTSYEKPYVIEIISNWCLTCMQIEDTWNRASSELKNLGVGTGVININRNPRLADHLDIDHVPQIVGVFKGQVHFFSRRVSVRDLKEFVVELFPRDLIQLVTTKNLDSFLDTQNNKPKVTLFTPKGSPSLLYHLVAFSNEKRLDFGFVSMSNGDGPKLRRKFKAHADVPTVMIFKEEMSVPEVVVQGSELKSGKLRNIVETNKYLILPRLSSQKVFNDLCTEERFRSRRKLCVVLFTKKGKHDKEKAKLRALVKSNSFSSERVHFTFIHEEIQARFASAVKNGSKIMSSSNGTVLKLAVLWNAGNSELRYTWLPGGWYVPDTMTAGPVARLKDMLENIISGSGKMKYKAKVPVFYDEEIPGPIHRIFSKIKNASYSVYQFATRKEGLSIVTMVLAFVFIGAVTVFLPQPSDLDKRNPKGATKQKARRPSQDLALGFIQLNRSTERELVRDAAPGQLTVTLLLDSVTSEEAAQSPLLQAYDDVVGGFKSMQNGRLLFKFAWLSVPDNLQWCTEVMNVDKFGEVIPGIVLVLNGNRTTVSVFKPTDLTKSEYFNNQGDGLMGFDDSDSDTDTRSDTVAEYERRRQRALSLSLRRELPRWLEKLTEGLVKREKLDDWPVLDE